MILQITGVFESEPVLTRAVRQAAKFASPEEEAAARRLEITGISNTTTASTTTAATTTTTTTSAIIVGEFATILVEELIAVPSNVELSTSFATQESEEEAGMSPLRASRKPNILEQKEASNPGFIACLSKTRGCDDSSAANSPVRIFSPKRTILPSTNNSSAVARDDTVKPKLDKSILLAKAKSKLLKVSISWSLSLKYTFYVTTFL